MNRSAADTFHEARELPADKQATYLHGACGKDAALRAKVEALLKADADAGDFMAAPTADGIARPPASSAATASQEQAGALIGRYKLLEQIGEGGMGTIWMAEQREPVRRRVALKIIKLGMDTKQVIARFEAERQALAMMDHPHIAKVLDAGATEPGRPYFVMEYIKGIPILEYCDQARLVTQARLGLFTSVCHAIQHAHQKGIIHRDIKPSNVLVTLHDGVPVPKVIDFGIAKATNSELTTKTLFTEHRQMIGTPAYMSPEQAEMSGLDIDTRSDVYALGVLLYELLTGTTPFDTKALFESGYAEMLRAIREDEPHKPSTRISSLGDTGTRTAQQRRVEVKKLSLLLRGDLDWIVMKCLEKDRTRRYETANGLAADIQRHLNDEPVTAGAPSSSYKLRKFVKRNRGPVLACGLVAVALVLGILGTAVSLRRALRAEADVRTQLAATETAQKAEKARADELAQVSDFQEKMLAQVNATTAGMRLTEDVNRRFAAALEKADVAEAERAGLADEFRENWAAVNATDAATALIDATILKPAVKAIDEQFRDQPIVDAQLRQALAQRYGNLGLYDAALPLQRSALETRRRVLGEEHVDTLASMNHLGYLLQAQGKLAEAEPCFRQALEERRRVLGEEHPDTLVCINNMGFLRQAQGRLGEAEPYYREALEKSRRVLGAEHRATLLYLNNMGFLLEAQRRYSEAEPYYREALEKRRRVLGEEHPDTLSSINNLGYLLESQGRFAEAEPYYREALQRSRRVQGEEHPATLTSINNMGSLLQSQGKLAEAESCYRDALEKSRRVLGEEHPDTLKSIGNLGNLLNAQSKLAEAEPYHRQALEGSRRVLGDDHPDTLTCFDNLGQALLARGEYGEAAAVLAEGVDACQRAFPSPRAITAVLLYHQADALRALGRLDEAAPGARRAVELYRDHPDWASHEAAHALAILAAVLTAQGQADEALTVQRERLALQRRRFPPGSADVSGSIAVCGLALLQRGTLDTAKEAEPLLRECLDIRLETMRGDWRVLNSKSLLGGAILAVAELNPTLTPEARVARLREAEPLLLDGNAGLADDPAVPSTAAIGVDRRREALERVVHLYEAWSRVEPDKGHDVKATEWRKLLDASAAPAKPGEK